MRWMTGGRQERMKVKITSDGKTAGTKVVNLDTGEIIGGVTAVTWHVRAGEPVAVATIELLQEGELEVEGEGKIHKVGELASRREAAMSARLEVYKAIAEVAKLFEDARRGGASQQRLALLLEELDKRLLLMPPSEFDPTSQGR